MKKKQLFIFLGAAGLILALFWAVVLVLAARTLFGLSSAAESVPALEITLCDEDRSDLCLVNFGANSLNRMVISFRLPDREYPLFYAKAKNRDTVSVYACEVAQSDATLALCTGVRTPLGETIDLEIYTTDDDKLIARGTFLVSAIAIPTPISQPSEAPALDDTATEEPVETQEPFIVEPPTLEIPTPDFEFEDVPTPQSPADELATPSPSDSTDGPPGSDATPSSP